MNKQAPKIVSLKTRAPAKLILSGEHSVVYGCPALGVAINRFATTTISWHPEAEILFDFLNLHYKSPITWDNLHNLKERIQEQYAKFLIGKCHIYDVLYRPFELLIYAFIHFVEKLNIEISTGVLLNTHSTIPIGCGMGSSAATIVSVLHAVANFFNLNMPHDAYVKLGREAENMQHGYSSGLDLYLSVHGGCALFQNGEASSRVLPKLPMCLVDTGKPKTSTGECIASAMKYFKKGQQLLNDFTAVTNAMDQALLQSDFSTLQKCVSTNHKLLQSIDVVPPKVQEFIDDLARLNMTAKICGAGASRGQSGGIVWVVGENDIQDLVGKYGYRLIAVHGENSGVQIL
jgi:mevalonate kinase